MKAVILAAGRGKRLSQTSPKPLTFLLGYTLIERTILSAKEYGITDFVIVVGYLGKDITEYLGSGEQLGVSIQFVQNPEWKKENGLSVLKAKEVVGNEDFILLMADHVFDQDLLSLLPGNTSKKCVLLVDENVEGVFDKKDATKVLVRNGSPIAIGKNLSKYNAVDCGIFYCTTDLFEALEGTVSKDRYRLSEAVQRLIDEGKLDVVDIDEGFWCDIDTQESLKYAEKKMLSSLVKPTDGFISKHFNRKISTKITKILVKTRITPNQLSILVFILSLTAAGFFIHMSEYYYLLIGGILVQLSSILDGCDGEVARLKFMKTNRGGFIDSVLDRYADSLIIFGLCYGYWLVTGNSLIWLAGFGALIGTLVFSYTNARHEEEFETTVRKGIPIRRDIRLFIIMIGALLNQVLVTLILIAILTNAENLRRITITSSQTS